MAGQTPGCLGPRCGASVCSLHAVSDSPSPLDVEFALRCWCPLSWRIRRYHGRDLTMVAKVRSLNEQLVSPFTRFVNGVLPALSGEERPPSRASKTSYNGLAFPIDCYNPPHLVGNVSGVLF